MSMNLLVGGSLAKVV